MGKIGDYIHARGIRYREYGINKDERGRRPSFDIASNQARNELKELIRFNKFNKIAEELSQFLTTLIYRSSEGFSGEYFSMTSAEMEEFKKDFIKQLEDGKYFELFNANLENLSFSSKTGIDNDILKNGPDASRKKGIQYRTIKKMSSYLTNLIQSLGGSDKPKNTAQASKILAEAEALNEQIIKMIQDSKLGEGDDYKIVGGTAATYDASGKKIADNDLITNFNRLVKQVSRPSHKDQGDLAEMFMGVVLNNLLSGTENTIDELINNNLIVGNKKTANKLSNFTASYKLTERLNRNNKKKNNGGKNSYIISDSVKGEITWNGEGSQGTVDMIIEVPDEAETREKFGVDKIATSIKNYGSKDEEHGVSIISGYPLINALMLFKSDFANHYLNLVVSHPKDGYNSFDNERHQAHAIMKKGLIARALGGVEQIKSATGKSDLFIVNSRADKKVYVYTTDDLLKKIWGDVDKYTNIKNYPEDLVGGNVWIESDRNNPKPNYLDAQTRIANVLAEIHKSKISISIPGSTLEAL